MLSRRIIVVFLLRDGRVVKSKQFKDYRDVGDPISQCRIAYANGADEIVLLNTQGEKGLDQLCDVLGNIDCFVPVAAGGGIRTMDDAKRIIAMGAEKVVIRSATNLLEPLSKVYGCQSIVQCIDYSKEEPPHPISAHAGEVIMQNMDRDGMMEGYDLNWIRYECMTDLPVILLGGCGNYSHMLEAFQAGAQACAASSIFCFTDSNPIRAKRWLRNHDVHVRSS